MFVILYREAPGKPWAFVTYHLGPLEKAEESARWTEEQERKILRHPRAETKVLTDAQFESGHAVRGRRRREKPAVQPVDQEPVFTLDPEPEPEPAAGGEDEPLSLRSLLDDGDERRTDGEV